MEFLLGSKVQYALHCDDFHKTYNHLILFYAYFF